VRLRPSTPERERTLSEPNVVTLHVRYRLLFRHMRGYILGVLGISFGLGVVVTLVARLTHSHRAAPAVHVSIASSLLLPLGPLLAISYVVWASRRFGYYARPGEVGTVGVVGRLTPFRQPTVRFHRFTMTNQRWIRFLGMGSAVSVPLVVGINGTGELSLLLTPLYYPQADIDSFLAASGLPIEGDWSERVGRFSIRKRWPGSKDTRRQGWIAAAVMLPTALLLMGGFVAAAVLVR
jgi:hypothetical protein